MADYFVYIVECADNTLYTGYTTDLEHRIKVHNRGRGAKYTRARLPVRLVYYERKKSKGDALSREYSIKQLSRSQKIKLIQSKDKEG